VFQAANLAAWTFRVFSHSVFQAVNLAAWKNLEIPSSQLGCLEIPGNSKQ
jgi:hypothetical protein